MVETIDGRETAPATFTETTFTDPATGAALAFATVVSSGLSVGVPGTPATWELAAERWGTERLGTPLKPAERIARNGFVVDQTFHDQTVANATRFAFFTETARVFLPGGEAPAVGSVFRNPDLARAYRELRTHGVDSLYSGRLGEAVVAEVRDPGTVPGVEVLPGELNLADLEAYRALVKAPVHSSTAARTSTGCPSPAAAGSPSPRSSTSSRPTTSARARRSRGRRRAVPPPVLRGERDGLRRPQPLGRRLPRRPDGGARIAGLRRRAGLPVRPGHDTTAPRSFGIPDGSYADCGPAVAAAQPVHEGVSTTHLSVVDRWGNAVAYTSTIEATAAPGSRCPAGASS